MQEGVIVIIESLASAKTEPAFIDWEWKDV